MKREDIIGKKFPASVKEIDAPGWGRVFVRRMSAAERVQVDYMRRENDGQPPNVEARLAVYFAADENGNRIFTNDDAKELGAEPAHANAIVAIVEAGLAFNFQNSEQAEDAKKNSEIAPN